MYKITTVIYGFVSFYIQIVLAVNLPRYLGVNDTFGMILIAICYMTSICFVVGGLILVKLFDKK